VLKAEVLRQAGLVLLERPAQVLLLREEGSARQMAALVLRKVGPVPTVRVAETVPQEVMVKEALSPKLHRQWVP